MPLVMRQLFTDGVVCVRSAHVTNGGSGGMMSTGGLELPYPWVSQAKYWDKTLWRGK